MSKVQSKPKLAKPEFRHQRIQWFNLLFAMSEKELKARYKNAALGFLWMILNPLLQMLIIGMVFQFFIPLPNQNYFLFLFAGLLPWNFFSLTLAKTTPLYVNERSLIRKAKFPREILAIAVGLANAFHLIISIALFLILIGVISLLFPSTNLVFSLEQLPVLILAISWLFILTTGLSLFLGALNVRYRDVNFGMQLLLQLWFYASPVLYNRDLIPPRFYNLLSLNPLFSIIEVFRWSLLGNGSVDVISVMVSLSLTVGIAIGGWMFFKRESQFFDDWI